MPLRPDEICFAGRSSFACAAASLKDESLRCRDLQKPRGRRCSSVMQGRAQGVGFGVKPPPLEVGILQKRYYLRKGDELFSHTFCLLICRLNANTTE